VTAAARGAAGYLYRNRARSKQREAERAAHLLRRQREQTPTHYSRAEVEKIVDDVRQLVHPDREIKAVLDERYGNLNRARSGARRR
jgi:hypothetical protein